MALLFFQKTIFTPLYGLNSGVRGLKRNHVDAPECHLWVAPRRGAWIETHIGSDQKIRRESRTPQGCVD